AIARVGAIEPGGPKCCPCSRRGGARSGVSGSAAAIRWTPPWWPAWSRRTVSRGSPAVGPDGDLIPVHIITGFLGSGKTTLLRGGLTSAAFAATAVAVHGCGGVALGRLRLLGVHPDT